MHTGRKIFYRLRGFGRSANQTMFPRGGDNEETASAAAVEQISVTAFFAEKYRRRLMYPHLPCINAIKGNENKPNWLPMEVVRVNLLIKNK
jgi:hypothetical protein